MIFSINEAAIKKNDRLLIGDLNLDIYAGECIWISGANGSGKSTMLEIIAGKERLACGEFRSNCKNTEELFSSVFLVRRDFSLYRSFTRSAEFYQQRYFSAGTEETPLVIDFIASETGKDRQTIISAALESGFEKMLQKHVISLSTGEERRILLLVLWLSDKKIICFDDPFSGLDLNGRKQVCNTFRIMKEKGITIIAAGPESNPDPVFDRILMIKELQLKEITSANGKMIRPVLAPSMVLKTHVEASCNDFSIASEMKNIRIQFNGNVVLKDFSWRIDKGDKWMLTGPNGSGKSTLMTLINGDNPMAYALEIVVFDKVRGSGETIWEIKEPIGYFSSELQQFFPGSLTTREAVLSGFGNFPHVRSDLSSRHCLQADELIEAAGLAAFKDFPLYRLSFTRVRISLVCRALVKHPPLVILDEPCQGLDDESSLAINNLIDSVCHGEEKTLIYVTHKSELVPCVIDKKMSLDTSHPFPEYL